MNESRFEKLAPLTGALFFVLLLLGSFLFPVNTYQPPAREDLIGSARKMKELALTELADTAQTKSQTPQP